MSAGSAQLGSPAPRVETAPGAPRRWIVNSWVDQALILFTPVLAIPALLILYSSWGVTAETISLIVTAFFATGHHLPGLLRAYGDRELFERFRWRFLLAPPLLFLAYFPLYTYHFDLYRLVILVWATWHGLMQLYGFVRIYDAKVGSISPVTAYWDWLLCLCGFITPHLLRPEHLSNFLGHWYSVGGYHVSHETLDTVRWACLAACAAILLGFAVNYVVQLVRGPQPNPLKLLMLSSGIGIWWYSQLWVDNLLLGLALFDICHDVQYLAIVWLFNCRRVNANPQLGRFMKYVFRRGMVLLYLGLICAYGAIAFAGSLVLDGTISRIFYGVLFTSTILHYYYDGFIWKVRETTNRAGLGLSQSPAAAGMRQMISPETVHLLKWAPVILVLALLFTTDFLDPSLTVGKKEELNRLYAKSLLGTPVLPATEEEQSWLYTRFEQVQQIASAVPEDRSMQVQAAVMLANFGRNGEAVDRLETLLLQHPDLFDALLTLGGIQLYRGNYDQAATHLQAAVSNANTPRQRAAAHLRLAELNLYRNDPASAESSFKAALQDDPAAAPAIENLRKRVSSLNAAQ